ncbi:unnamed protein product [Didymodactylos carnosus]|uniref:Beta-sarcoglycan n=1 Tax=Didymodactylos carnosus TaxID=1234261 RepID=A0A814SL64_9BILA|nr:unnamed protein product [Didymodactylos carnosus]CAF1302077.1 unnamed protein product [Didymodactylos carnosus]CAF3912743.1 unnamed protein product [Didymodactylos carnosus]CAF4108757.1 unnamed protein product [Didymodactylos carnosus]
MGKKSNRCPNNVNLDAGYVAIDQSSFYNHIGLRGKKLACFLISLLVLLFISLANLGLLIWLMHKLNWSLSGSKAFTVKKNEFIINKQTNIPKSIYVTKIRNIKNSSELKLHSNKQIDIYGQPQALVLDNDRVSMNTDHFYVNYDPLNFMDIHSYSFNRSVRVHIDQLNSRQIQSRKKSSHSSSSDLDISANGHLSIKNINEIYVQGQNLLLSSKQKNNKSTIKFSKLMSNTNKV